MNGVRRCARVIIISGERMLLIHRFKGDREFWVAPGGTMEKDETPEQTAVREAKEETSLDVVLDKEIFVIDDERQRTYYFSVKRFSGEVKLGGEEAEINCSENQFILEWIPLKEVKSLKFFNKETNDVFRGFVQPNT